MGLTFTMACCAAVPALTVRFTATDGAGAESYTLTRGLRVFDVSAIKTSASAGGETLTVSSTGDAITDAISLAVADQAIVRAAQIDDDHNRIASGGILRVTTVGAQSACDVHIQCIPG